METVTPWATKQPVRSPFALPGGLPGWLAGSLMLRTNRQHAVLGLLDIQPGTDVLEIGYGPGRLIQLLQSQARRICGADPSPQMRDMATRRHCDGIGAGRIDLRLGTAAHTGFGDAEFDRVVSVNHELTTLTVFAAAR